MRALSACPLAILFLASSVAAQSTVGDPRCAVALNAPTADTVVSELAAIVQPFDRETPLSDSYRVLVAQGILQFFRAPQPLELDTYDPRGTAAAPIDQRAKELAALTVRAVYRFTLHRSGRLTNWRAVGGVRSFSFDNAILAALSALDSAQMLPPVSDSVRFDNDSLEMRLLVTPHAFWSVRAAPPPLRLSGSVPLLRLRVPVREVTQKVWPQGQNPTPRYPEEMRAEGVQGDVVLEFVVDPSGVPDVSTVQVLRAPGLPFVRAVLAVLPRSRYTPLLIAGCPVRALVQQPFQFSLAR